LDNAIRSYLLFKLSLIENEAKDVDVIDKLGIYSIDSISISKNHIGQHMPISIVHPKSEYDLHFIGFPNPILFETEDSYFFFSLNFKDTIGNVYNQLFTVHFKDDMFLQFTSGNAERVIVEPEKQSKLKRLILLITENK
jgi:hypothetical protein